MSPSWRVARLALFLLMGICAVSGNAIAQTTPTPQAIWKDADQAQVARSIRMRIGREPRRDIVPQIYRTVELNKPALRAALDQALPEESGPIQATGAELSIPLPGGGYGRFLIQDSP